MNLKVFCNKCLKTDTNGLLVTSCRHVLCSECYAKGNRKCAVCQLPCKAIRFDQLPEEMLVYFKPIVPMLKKHLKIARFQLQQRSLWTDRKKFVLERMHRKKQIANEKKDKLVELRQGYKFAVHQNTDLKLQLKKTKCLEPSNPFEMNSNRHLAADEDLDRVQSNPIRTSGSGRAPSTSQSFNSSSRSSLSSRSNASFTPLLHHTTPRHMSSTVNTNSFFNGSAISASSSLNSTDTSSSSRTSQLRRLMQNSTISSL